MFIGLRGPHNMPVSFLRKYHWDHVLQHAHIHSVWAFLWKCCFCACSFKCKWAVAGPTSLRKWMWLLPSGATLFTMCAQLMAVGIDALQFSHTILRQNLSQKEKLLQMFKHGRCNKMFLNGKSTICCILVFYNESMCLLIQWLTCSNITNANSYLPCLVIIRSNFGE